MEQKSLEYYTQNNCGLTQIGGLLNERYYAIAMAKGNTTLLSLMNSKHSPHRFWPCHENGLIKTIQMIPHNIHVSFKLASLYCGLRLILVYRNP